MTDLFSGLLRLTYMYMYMHMRITLYMPYLGMHDSYISIAYTCTVESRDYAPPPLCMLGLDKSGEGAYTRDPYISV